MGRERKQGKRGKKTRKISFKCENGTGQDRTTYVYFFETLQVM
jgi:hypothetical protein